MCIKLILLFITLLTSNTIYSQDKKSIILHKLNNNELFYKCKIIEDAYIYKDNVNSYDQTTRKFLEGDSVLIYYIKNGFAYVNNETKDGFIKLRNLEATSSIIDSLQCLGKDTMRSYMYRQKRFFIEKRIKYVEYQKSIRDSIIKLKQDSILKAEQDSIKVLYKKGYPISIISSYFGKNSVGLITPYIKYRNNTNKTIKYITFIFYFKNAVDDIVYNTISKSESKIHCKDTGPIIPFKETHAGWNTTFYNTTAREMYLEGIKIIYMDKTSLYLSKNKIHYSNNYLNIKH